MIYIIIPILFFIIVYEISTHSAFGSSYIINSSGIDFGNSCLNMFDENIISFNKPGTNLSYISISNSILSTYYISIDGNVKRILKYTKLHYFVKGLHNNLINKIDAKTYIRDIRINNILK